jgi:hypothetical protein
LLTRFTTELISKWLDSTEKQDRLCAHAALSALFQADGEVATGILLSGSVLREALDCVEFESDDVQLAVVEMLSQACSFKKCRAAIASMPEAQTYLSGLTASKDERLKTTASVALTKMMIDGKAGTDEPGNQGKDTRLAQLFQDHVLDAEGDYGLRATAIEGLAYASLKPAIKEMVARHPSLLKAMFKIANDMEKNNGMMQYGIAVILSNITTYQKKLSEQDQQVLRLRQMAGEAANVESDPLDADDCVAKRNKKALDAGVVPVLNIIARAASQAIRQLVAQVFLNLATDQTNRGVIVQLGGTKALISLTANNSEEGAALASQALAKIAITMDPRVAFPNERAADLVRPFLTLCQAENELRQFEALMALTNLVSVYNDIRTRLDEAKGVRVLENMQFSDNVMVRRAATECLCNMMFCESVYDLYSDPERATNRIKIMVALSDVEDFATRRAASGALAILSTSESVCHMIADQSRGIEVLCDLLRDRSPELHHRGAEICKNMASTGRELAQRLVTGGAYELMTELVKASKVETVVVTCVEAIKEIAEYSDVRKDGLTK